MEECIPCACRDNLELMHILQHMKEGIDIARQDAEYWNPKGNNAQCMKERFLQIAHMQVLQVFCW